MFAKIVGVTGDLLPWWSPYDFPVIFDRDFDQLRIFEPSKSVVVREKTFDMSCK